MVADVVDAVAVTRPRIRVQGAVKSFSGRVVVDVDDLVLGDRPIEGLIGPNGAGKTTLMRMIMHSTPLDRGTDLPPAARGTRGGALEPARAPDGAPRRGEVQPGDHGLRQADHLGFAPARRGRGQVRAAPPDLQRAARSSGGTRTRSGTTWTTSGSPTRRRSRCRPARRSSSTSSAACSCGPRSCCSTSRPPACPTT